MTSSKIERECFITLQGKHVPMSLMTCVPDFGNGISKQRHFLTKIGQTLEYGPGRMLRSPLATLWNFKFQVYLCIDIFTWSRLFKSFTVTYDVVWTCRKFLYVPIGVQGSVRGFVIQISRVTTTQPAPGYPQCTLSRRHRSYHADDMYRPA